ncbi:MAG: CoA-binding protein [candidate division Zixibacteria bacterium]|nr:CoA-binding protein [candidate division Zixibacteria bacterium]
MDNAIPKFIASKHIAVIGVSAKRRKFGNIIYSELKKKSYHAYPINSKADLIDGEQCYRDLLQVPDEVKAAVVVVKPEHTDGLVEMAAEKGIEILWFQQGANFSEVAEAATNAGIAVIQRKCLLMYAPPVTGIHAVHRFFAKLFNRL